MGSPPDQRRGASAGGVQRWPERPHGSRADPGFERLSVKNETTERDPRNIRARSLRIDPVARTVTRGLDSWNSALEWIGADLLERVGCGADVDCWIDEEGALRDGQTFWVLGGDQMLAGRAVLVGGVGGEWTDLPAPSCVATAAIRWIPESFAGVAQEIADGMRPVAVAWNEEGMAQLAKMQREHEGRVELLAVASVPAVLTLELGDVVTDGLGRSGFVEAIDGDRVTVLYVDGTRTHPMADLKLIDMVD